MNVEYEFASNDLSGCSSSELCSILEIFILNSKITCPVTHICFELCRRMFQSHLKPKGKNKFTDIEDVSLQQVTEYIERLSFQGRLSHETFREMIYDELLNENILPLQILSVLDKSNIMYFEEYCSTRPSSTILAQLTTIFKSPSNQSNQQNRFAARDLLMKLILAANNGTCTNTAALWSIRSKSIIDDFINLALEELFQEPDNARLIEFVPLIGELETVYGIFLKAFFYTILEKAVTYKEKVSIQDAYIMQELWTIENLPAQTVNIYHELLKFHTMEDLNELIKNDPDKQLNWKVILTLVSVFVNKINDGFKQVKALVQQRLQALFSNSKLETNDVNITLELLSILLLARQSCLEQQQPQLAYSEWYSSMFGLNSNLPTGSDATAFSLLLTTFMSQINREPTYVLRSHIDRSMRTPSGCQSDMLLYKNLCREQLARLGQSAIIKVNNKSIPIIIILEDSLNRFDCSWALKQSNIVQGVLPYIIEDSKYDRLKEILLSNGFISQTEVQKCRTLTMQTSEIAPYEDSEEFFL